MRAARPAPPADVEAIASQYQLGDHALAGAPGPRRGLVLLVREGVVAWMRAWAQVPPPPPALRGGRPVTDHSELVRLLAEPALSRGAHRHGRPMMDAGAHSKVTSEHLERHAYLTSASPACFGVGEHRVDPPPIRLAATGRGTGLAHGTDRGDRLRPGPVRTSAADREGFQLSLTGVG